VIRQAVQVVSAWLAYSRLRECRIRLVKGARRAGRERVDAVMSAGPGGNSSASASGIWSFVEDPISSWVDLIGCNIANLEQSTPSRFVVIVVNTPPRNLAASDTETTWRAMLARELPFKAKRHSESGESEAVIPSARHIAIRC
jgi:hypothetical protein